LIIKFYLFLYNLKNKFIKRAIASLLRHGIFINNIQTIKLNDFLIRLNLSQSIDREIFLKRVYEEGQLNFLKKISTEESFDYFFDIGANIGYYSLFLNHIKKIFAFEPNKTVFKNLKQNVEINNFNIAAYNFGVSDNNGSGQIWYNDKNKMSGSSILDVEDKEIKKYNNNKIYKDQIETKILDSFLKIEKSKILIKIDVERHESKVLDGMKLLLKNNKIFLQIEIHNELKDKILSKLDFLEFKFIQSIGIDYYFKNYWI